MLQFIIFQVFDELVKAAATRVEECNQSPSPKPFSNVPQEELDRRTDECVGKDGCIAFVGLLFVETLCFDRGVLLKAFNIVGNVLVAVVIHGSFERGCWTIDHKLFVDFVFVRAF